MDISIIFLLTIGCMALIVGVRNELVFRIRTKRIYTLNSVEDFADFDELSYHAMIFDLSKWTYKQFYGDN